MADLKQVRAGLKRAMKEAGVACRNLPLTLTGLFVLSCVELFAILYLTYHARAKALEPQADRTKTRFPSAHS